MPPFRPLIPLCAFAAALAACGEKTGTPVVVSVIGDKPVLANADRGPLPPAAAVLAGAVAEGLVAMDATGQIEPALAERWIVTDDGLSYIFRLRPATGANGKPITANDVVRRLRAAIARSSRNPLRADLALIDSVSATTPQIIEIRLRAPRPPLLNLLAQPEMAVTIAGGAGPLRQKAEDGVIHLTPLPEVDEDGEPLPPAPDRTLRLRGERAALAVTRFVRGEVDLVLGGGYGDLPIARLGVLRGRDVRVDPAEGLFGLMIAGDTPFFADPDIRRALAMAIDRQALMVAVGGNDARPDVAILPERYRSAADPAVPRWAGLTQADRQASAHAIVAGWRGREGPPPPIRIALPATPGATLLFGRLAADWLALGLTAVRVAEGDAADIRVVDALAPAPSAIWYLRTALCPAPARCDPAAGDALAQANIADTAAARGQALAEADQALVTAAHFIVLGRPVRWALATRRLTEFRENPRAWHPLNHLIAAGR
ncbi:ABC transporter substrate-binding protein [Sphingomonas flavalba]|uniref:ABC transporter substrate-binding protein n=1 Tax=Sphingomonas flavalba TaxID=2559804 RepID=UPI0039E05B1D